MRDTTLKLRVSDDDDEIYLFERVIKYLQSAYHYSYEESVKLINNYYSNFTSSEFCKKYKIPIQNTDFFFHIEARSMADRVHYYESMDNTPNENKFIQWQRKIRD